MYFQVDAYGGRERGRIGLSQGRNEIAMAIFGCVGIAGIVSNKVPAHRGRGGGPGKRRRHPPKDGTQGDESRLSSKAPVRT